VDRLRFALGDERFRRLGGYGTHGRAHSRNAK
jgi:hypothetical protein